MTLNKVYNILGKLDLNIIRSRSPDLLNNFFCSRIIFFLCKFIMVIIKVPNILLTALFYFIYKLLFWERFTLGLAPLVIGGFFFASCLMFFLGIIGEYVGSIHTQVLKRPLVVEKERLNFENESR